MKLFLPAVAILVGAAIACSSPGPGGSPPPIHASSYDQHCAVATDCAIVNEGDACGCQGCGNAAINKSALSKYQSDLSNLEKQCPTGAGQICTLACIYTEASCNAGTCAVCHAPGCTDGGAPDSGAADASHD